MKPDMHKIEQESLTKSYAETLENMTNEDIIQMICELNYLKKQLQSQSDVIARLKQEAHHDPLTNLPNRRLFERELDKALAYFYRYHHQGSVLIVDTNSFKAINDSLGHQAGDAVLKHIAQLLKKHTRSADTVARIGGDEFAVILREAGNEKAFAKAEKLVEIIAGTPCSFNGREIYTSVSIGKCSFTEAATKKDLLNKADKAMYSCKNNATMAVA